MGDRETVLDLTADDRWRHRTAVAATAART